MQSLVGANRIAPEECIGTESEFFVTGAIVDSWVESARSADAGALLILQLAPLGAPQTWSSLRQKSRRSPTDSGWKT